MSHKKLRHSVVSCLVSCAGLVSSAFGQSIYPSKPLTVLVAVQAGTGGDVAVRGLMDKVSASLGQPIVIENVTGASGYVAAQRLLRSPADGYTLAVLSSGMTALSQIDPSVRFDLRRDVSTVGMIVNAASVLYVNPSVPAKTLSEFIQYAKTTPGKLAYASGGSGSPQHLAMEMFKSSTGIDMLHVPYKGSGQATLDVLGGRVDAAIQGIVQVAQYAKTNQIRLLAWTGRQRNPLFPDLPTVQEAGVKGYVYESWLGLFAPPHVPTAIVNRLNAELAKASSQTDLRDRWLAQGLETKVLSPVQMEVLIRDEFEMYGRIVRERKIKAD